MMPAPFQNLNYDGNNVIILRDRLFHTLFVRFAILYARNIPKSLRQLFELTIFFKALLTICILTYAHVVFVKSNVGCLDHIIDKWPRDGILRVEINRNVSESYSIQDSYRRERGLLHMIYKNETIYEDDEKPIFELSESEDTNTEAYKNKSFDAKLADTILPNSPIPSLLLFAKTVLPSDDYILEYSLEYGFLRLSPSTRQRLNITIMVVTLDPDKHPCFGGWFSRFLLEHVHGYDNILMASIKNIAEKEENKGFLSNVITGQHYRYVKIFASRNSYLIAILIMLTFTIAISMILRYSHQQLFFFIVELLQRFEHNNISIAFPVASLLIVILALVGLESIMAEFFNDTTTTFYVILLVWLADQYNSICCITPISKKHWLRFFYLYHYFFYAYHYRFNGQYSFLAFLVSWLFIQHSMIYFFHHYELPAILRVYGQMLPSFSPVPNTPGDAGPEQDGNQDLPENSDPAPHTSFPRSGPRFSTLGQMRPADDNEAAVDPGQGDKCHKSIEKCRHFKMAAVLILSGALQIVLVLAILYFRPSLTYKLQERIFCQRDEFVLIPQ